MTVDDSLGLGVGEVTVVLSVTRDREHAGSITDIEEVVDSQSDSQVGLTLADLDGEGLVDDNVKVSFSFELCSSSNIC